ncbi:hypothetical protein HAX54_003809 [Datura stramonium]|uniref:Uncharacterized protein n=1 Tax=Datura stramonium TaxID=4076 RepID=A0ABS8WSH9_DATST|nr:hypothetical protein [Datura stramonium]
MTPEKYVKGRRQVVVKTWLENSFSSNIVEIREIGCHGWLSPYPRPLGCTPWCLASITEPSTMDGLVVLVAPSDKFVYDYVTPSITLTSAQLQANANNAPQ